MSAPTRAQIRRYERPQSTPAESRQLRGARHDAANGLGQSIDVDGDGVRELFVIADDLYLDMFRQGRRTRLARVGAYRITDAEVGVLAQNGLAVVTLMTGSAHNVTYSFFAIHVVGARAEAVGSISSTDALVWLSLVNLNASPEPEVVFVEAPEGNVSAATIRVFERHDRSMRPMPGARAARQRSAAGVRQAALRGQPDAVRLVASIYPEDWRVRAAAARRAIAAGEYATEHALWALARAPARQRSALEQEFSSDTEFDSWPYGLRFESFPCIRTFRPRVREATMRWTIESSCLRSRR